MNDYSPTQKVLIVLSLLLFMGFVIYSISAIVSGQAQVEDVLGASTSVSNAVPREQTLQGETYNSHSLNASVTKQDGAIWLHDGNMVVESFESTNVYFGIGRVEMLQSGVVILSRENNEIYVLDGVIRFREMYIEGGQMLSFEMTAASIEEFDSAQVREKYSELMNYYVREGGNEKVKQEHTLKHTFLR